MSVIVLLTTKERRRVAEADGARVEGEFFLITRWYPDLRRVETLLTLRAVDVIGAQIENDGATEWVPGAGGVQNTPGGRGLSKT